jgi:hypothetical protein|tara:strand:+ start:1003 stop:1608 length:606 start_codon:yes stop_codon:yes gene_type:complete
MKLLEQWGMLYSMLLEDDNIGNSDDVVMQTPGMYAYIPMKRYNELVNANGILTLNSYVSSNPSRREKQNQFSHFGSACRNSGNPHNSKSIRVFFSRIPEDISECSETIKENYVPVKISNRKILDAKENFKVFGVNFPGTKSTNWTRLNESHISKLNDLKEKWNKFFIKDCNMYNLYNSIPHGAIYSESGMIPKFAFKNIRQ